VRSPATPPTGEGPAPSADAAAPSADAAAPSADAAAPPGPSLRLDRYDNSDFDRGARRIKEALWILCKCVFFLNPFPWPSALRAALLRLFGASIGCGLVIRSGAHVTFPWRLTVGDHVWIGEDVLILSLAPVKIGSHVCLSQRAFLCTGSHAWRRETFDLRTRPITIGDGVWISAQAFVAAGVSIGSGSVVGAGCVVTASVPENSLARGNPATVVSKFLV
jgi:putative colanic acid biosynthesis acetyltransferase WcaF